MFLRVFGLLCSVSMLFIINSGLRERICWKTAGICSVLFDLQQKERNTAFSTENSTYRWILLHFLSKQRTPDMKCSNMTSSPRSCLPFHPFPPLINRQSSTYVTAKSWYFHIECLRSRSSRESQKQVQHQLIQALKT